MYSHFSINQFLKNQMDYISVITDNQIKNFETNYSSKQLLQHKINESEYQNELPAAILTLTPNNPSNNENLKFQYIGDGLNSEEIIVGENKTKKQQMFAHIKFEHFSLQVRINCHDAFQTVSFIDSFTNVMPLHRWYYPFEYYDYVESTRLTTKYQWDFTKDNIENLIEQIERTSGKRLWFSKLHTAPLIRLNNVDHEVDYDQGRFAVVVQMDVRLPLPHSLMITDFHQIKEIVSVVEIQSQKDKSSTSYIESDGINKYVDDSTKLSTLVNPKLLDFDSYKIVLQPEVSKQVKLNDIIFPKTILFLDPDNMSTDKNVTNIVLKESDVKIETDQTILNLGKYANEIDKFKLVKTPNQLIILNTFEEDRFQNNEDYVDNVKENIK